MFHHTRSRIQYISCRLIERKINIQRIEYGLKKKKKNQTTQETKFTLFDLQEIEQIPPRPEDEMMKKPATLDCNDR